MINTIRNILDRMVVIVCSTWLLIMVCMTCWQILSRYLLSTPSTYSEEFLRFSLVWLSLLAMAYVAGLRKHVRFTLFSDKAPVQWQRYWHALIELAFLAFAIGILIVGGYHASSISMHQTSPSLRLPMGYIYFALPAAGALLASYSLLNCIQLLKGDITPDEENI